MKQRILCTVSSGYSSVMMAILVRNWYPEADIVNIMANTSREREESLLFMDQCDKHFRLDLVWVEADINPEPRQGTTHFVKTFETLTRDGSIFENGIIKYGLPSKINKWCNRELKLNAIQSYARSIGWGNLGEYQTAIGLRADEIDRISSNKDEYSIIYPLIERGIVKRDRNRFWANQQIKITIPGYLGNCKNCQEFSFRKLATAYLERPEDMHWNITMQNKYSTVPKANAPSYNHFIERDGGHYSLRGNKPWEYIIDLSKTKFSKATDEYIYINDLFDKGGSCDQGCDIFESLTPASM